MNIYVPGYKVIFIIIFSLAISIAKSESTNRFYNSSGFECLDTDYLVITNFSGHCISKVTNSLGQQPKPVPDSILENIARIADASSMLNVCLSSEEYLTLDSDLALKIFDLSSRLETVVLTISSYYDDEKLLFVYQMSVVKRSDESEFKTFANKKYGPCSEKLSTDLEEYTNYIEDQFRSF